MNPPKKAQPLKCTVCEYEIEKEGDLPRYIASCSAHGDTIIICKKCAQKSMQSKTINYDDKECPCKSPISSDLDLSFPVVTSKMADAKKIYENFREKIREYQIINNTTFHTNHSKDRLCWKTENCEHKEKFCWGCPGQTNCGEAYSFEEIDFINLQRGKIKLIYDETNFADYEKSINDKIDSELQEFGKKMKRIIMVLISELHHKRELISTLNADNFFNLKNLLEVNPVDQENGKVLEIKHKDNSTLLEIKNDLTRLINSSNLWRTLNSVAFDFIFRSLSSHALLEKLSEKEKELLVKKVNKFSNHSNGLVQCDYQKIDFMGTETLDDFLTQINKINDPPKSNPAEEISEDKTQ